MTAPLRGRRDTRFLAPLLLVAFAGIVLARRPSGSGCLPCGLPGAQFCPVPAEASQWSAPTATPTNREAASASARSRS